MGEVADGHHRPRNGGALLFPAPASGRPAQTSQRRQRPPAFLRRPPRRKGRRRRPDRGGAPVTMTGGIFRPRRVWQASPERLPRNGRSLHRRRLPPSNGRVGEPRPCQLGGHIRVRRRPASPATRRERQHVDPAAAAARGRNPRGNGTGTVAAPARHLGVASRGTRHAGGGGSRPARPVDGPVLVVPRRSLGRDASG